MDFRFPFPFAFDLPRWSVKCIDSSVTVIMGQSFIQKTDEGGERWD